LDELRCDVEHKTLCPSTQQTLTKWQKFTASISTLAVDLGRALDMDAHNVGKRGSGMFASSFCRSAAVSRYVMGAIASHAGWPIEVILWHAI
jgi:hypothetical protein